MRIQINSFAPAGSIALPPSKSMAHRLLICAALAGGVSRLGGLALSEDIRATIGALEALGATVDFQETGESVVTGACFADENFCPKTDIDCKESGSTLRFMIPLFALSDTPCRLIGAERLLQRPLHVYESLFHNSGLPFTVERTSVSFQGPLQAGSYTLAGNISSQFISGLLFALPLLEQDSVLHITPPFESRDYVQLTRAAQAQFGVQSTWENPFTLHIRGGQRYHPGTAFVEGDWSQAAVPAVLAAVCGPLFLKGLQEDSQQGDRVILDILRRCGAKIVPNHGGYTIQPGEGDLQSPGRIDLANCPDLGPILCVLALFCEGTTEIYNAGRLREKESDRIDCVEQELAKLGAKIYTTQDSIRIEGGHALHRACTQSHNDHRVVMALSAAAVCGKLPLQIEEAQAICKSWPTFFEDLQGIGIQTEEI